VHKYLLHNLQETDSFDKHFVFVEQCGVTDKGTWRCQLQS